MSVQPAAAGGAVENFQETSSGHSTFKKVLFTTCVFSSPFAYGVISSMRDIYVLKFGANVEAMATVSFIVMFASAFCDPISGYLQDSCTSWYSCLMPKETWGKRAPYVTFSMLCVNVFFFLSYFPPSGALVIWYLIMFLGSVICTSTINVGYTVSVYSLYKFKKERVIVEGYGYIMKTFGLLLGYGFFVVTLQDARLGVRFVQAIIGIGLLLIVIPGSMKIMKEARDDLYVKSKSQPSLGSLYNCAKDMLRNVDSFQWLALIYAADASRASLTLIITYYLTYTSDASIGDRTSRSLLFIPLFYFSSSSVSSSTSTSTSMLSSSSSFL